MTRLRTRLILIFAIATLVPLAVTLYITEALLEHSLSLAPVRELDDVSRVLELTGRALYQTSRDAMKKEITAGRLKPDVFADGSEDQPPEVRAFRQSSEAERYESAGSDGERLVLLQRQGSEILRFTMPIAGPGMRRIAKDHASAREVVYQAQTRNLRKGYTFTLITVSAALWLISLAVLVAIARRISKPMEQLTSGLHELAAGNLGARLSPSGRDEVSKAMEAFNNTAERLQESQGRLVYMTRVESWRTLAKKMAHEVKNSLTPIRLTMEEIMARKNEPDNGFIEQAAQIVADEVTTLERRVRAFSQFATEPPVLVGAVELNGLIEERIAFLKKSNPGVVYEKRLQDEPVQAKADEHLLRSILTNLLENAAQAAGPGGVVLGKTLVSNGKVAVEIHDSGPGLSEQARSTLFEPTITFKKTGMGLGLSIVKKSAIALGGDVALVEGELGGAGFRVILPRATEDAS